MSLLYVLFVVLFGFLVVSLLFCFCARHMLLRVDLLCVCVFSSIWDILRFGALDHQSKCFWFFFFCFCFCFCCWFHFKCWIRLCIIFRVLFIVFTCLAIILRTTCFFWCWLWFVMSLFAFSFCKLQHVYSCSGIDADCYFRFGIKFLLLSFFDLTDWKKTLIVLISLD